MAGPRLSRCTQGPNPQLEQRYSLKLDFKVLTRSFVSLNFSFIYFAAVEVF